MNRRIFLLSLAAVPALRVFPQTKARITRFTLCTIEGRFHKFVAMNSYDQAPKGRTYSNTLVRIFTDQGVEGVGVMGYAEPDAAFLKSLKTLIGLNPLELYEMREGRISGRAPAFSNLLETYKHLDGPLFDLIGKLTEKPAWKLIGESVRDRVEAYDGTLYFSDLWFKERGVQAVIEEAEEAVKAGYPGLKFKVGRGWKWMGKEEGLRQDIEVLEAVRQSLGKEVKVLADANNGYRDDFERAWTLMDETRDVNLYWMEEIFPESVDGYRRLRQQMENARIKTLIADGESVGDPRDFEPYLKPQRLMDVLQMDIRHGGFMGNLEMARLGADAGAIAVPHNWASQVGKFMGLHLAKAVENVTAAEDDRSTCDAITADGYTFEKGFYTVPDSPGLGLRVNEEIYREKYEPKQVVVT
jgi:L-alanine-DL-glutamate epimerase-like enolase superfamily enzyme